MIEKLKYINKKIAPGKYIFSPEWIVLGVNNVCNLHCKMCDVGTNSLESNFAVNLVGTHPINMPLDLVKKIIDDVSTYYPSTKLGYAFTEPLVYPQLIESLQYANDNHIFTSITTNALTLEHKAAALVDAGLNELYVSLDGPEKIHNDIRGHRKSFQKALEGIHKIYTHNPKQSVSVFCVITEWNIGYLTQFLEEIKHLPLQHVGFMHTNFTPHEVADIHNIRWSKNYPATVSNIEEVTIENFDLELLLEEIEFIKKQSFQFPISFSPELNSREQLDIFYKHPEVIIGKGCNDIFRNIMIKSDGSVIPAHGRCYNIELGNIYQESIKEIWQSNGLKQIRKDLHNEGGLFPACSRCCSAF